MLYKTWPILFLYIGDTSQFIKLPLCQKTASMQSYIYLSIPLAFNSRFKANLSKSQSCCISVIVQWSTYATQACSRNLVHKNSLYQKCSTITDANRIVNNRCRPENVRINTKKSSWKTEIINYYYKKMEKRGSRKSIVTKDHFFVGEIITYLSGILKFSLLLPIQWHL